MLSHDRLSRFLQMERHAAQLRERFDGLTSAHSYFQGRAALKSISVSDACDDGCIDTVFMGAFTFDSEGVTDLEAGIDGQPVTLHAGAPQIILMFLERALAANRRM